MMVNRSIELCALFNKNERKFSVNRKTAPKHHSRNTLKSSAVFSSARISTIDNCGHWDLTATRRTFHLKNYVWGCLQAEQLFASCHYIFLVFDCLFTTAFEYFFNICCIVRRRCGPTFSTSMAISSNRKEKLLHVVRDFCDKQIIFDHFFVYQ